MKRFSIIAVVAAVVSLFSSFCQPATAGNQKSLTLEHCVVSLVSEAQISARKPGAIVRFEVAEGSFVAAGDPLAQIDAAESQVQATVALRQLQAAQKRASNDIDVRYAQAASEVAKAEVSAARDANRRVAGTVPDSEIRRLQLAEQRSLLGIEQAAFEFAAAKLDTAVAEARVEAADLDVATRRVVSPIAGVVVRLHRRQGEYVDVGQPICHIVGLDRLRVTGFVNVKQHDQSAIMDRDVIVSIRLTNGQLEEFAGQLALPSPPVHPGGDYRVWAEVDNRRQGKFWLLRPGLAADMTITLN